MDIVRRAVASGRSPLPVPTPLFTVPETACLAYRKLPGVPATPGSPVAPALAVLLQALHGINPDRVRHLVPVDDDPLETWHHDAGECYARIADRLGPDQRAGIEAFLGDPLPEGGHEPVFSHNDLGVEHVLVDPATGAVTGILDWSDAALCDPAYDFGLLWRDLGAAAAAVVPGGLRERALFYARCGILEDLDYGRPEPPGTLGRLFALDRTR